MGRVPDTFIESVRERLDLVSFVAARVPTLKKSGQGYTACCPFHDERTPSFHVHPSKQVFHCFGCGAHGDVFAFAMQFHSCTFLDALTMCAQELGMPMPEKIATPEAHTVLFTVMAKAQKYFQACLRDPNLGRRTRAYLTARGIGEEAIEQFGLGFALNYWDGLMRALKGVPLDQLVDAGLVVRTDNKTYDRFRDRLIFPIRDSQGRVVGFGGRTLGDDKPKYLNSPETVIFHKKTELYGWHERKGQLGTQAILVEGYCDVITLVQAGIAGVFAALGTALSEVHLQRIWRSYDRLYLCFDGDDAGRKASWSALLRLIPLLQVGKQVFFVQLPDGLDPDALVRAKGKAGFEALLTQAESLSTYLLRMVATQTGSDTPDQRAAFVHQVDKIVQNMNDTVLRDLIRQTCKERVGLLQRSTNVAQDWAKPSSMTGRREGQPRCRSAAWIVFYGLYLNPEWLEDVTQSDWLDRKLDLDGLEALKKLVTWLREQPMPINRDALESLAETLGYSRRSFEEFALSGLALRGEVRAAVAHINELGKKQNIESLLHRARTQEGLSDAEKRQLMQLLAAEKRSVEG
ncbi:MAG: DNA primase [Pseudomonadota bacterium]